MARSARDMAERRIADSICAAPVFAHASTIVGYLSLEDEASVSAVLSSARSSSKQVWLPVVDGLDLRFGRFEEGVPLQRGRFGVLEPANAPLSLAELVGADTLVLVPGRAFDGLGRRLGRGGGFYDRALAAGQRGATTLGVGYACQLVDAVPVDERDHPVDGVVTESGLQWSEAPAGADR